MVHHLMVRYIESIRHFLTLIQLVSTSPVPRSEHASRLPLPRRGTSVGACSTRRIRAAAGALGERSIRAGDGDLLRYI